MSRTERQTHMLEALARCSGCDDVDDLERILGKDDLYVLTGDERQALVREGHEAGTRDQKLKDAALARPQRVSPPCDCARWSDMHKRWLYTCSCTYQSGEAAANGWCTAMNIACRIQDGAQAPQPSSGTINTEET